MYPFMLLLYPDPWHGSCCNDELHQVELKHNMQQRWQCGIVQQCSTHRMQNPAQTVQLHRRRQTSANAVVCGGTLPLLQTCGVPLAKSFSRSSWEAAEKSSWEAAEMRRRLHCCRFGPGPLVVAPYLQIRLLLHSVLVLKQSRQPELARQEACALDT